MMRIAFPAPAVPLLKDESGSITVISAFMLIGLMGLAALGLDISLWYRTKQSMQTAADAAALAGAHELDRIGRDDPAIRNAATLDAENHGFGPANGATLALTVTDGEHVEAVITARMPLRFASLLMSAPPTASARAVASIPSGAPPCLTVLDPKHPGSLDLAAGARISAPACRLNVNSKAKNNAIKGSGYVDAAQVCAVGGVQGDVTSSGEIETECAVYPDPLADWYPPNAPGSCDASRQRKFSGGSHVVLNGSTVFYCDEVEIEDGAHVEFRSGIYFIRKGGLTIKGGSHVEGTGVAFVLLGDSRIEVADGSTVDLTAPTAGPMAGIVITHGKTLGCTGTGDDDDDDDDDDDEKAGCGAKKGIEHKIVGGSDVQYEGAIYLPEQYVTYQDQSSSSNIPPFTTYIVKRLKLDSGAELMLDNNYAASNVPVVGKSNHNVRLTE